MERGYVKLWRKTLDSGLLQNDNAFRLFGYLLLNVTFTEKKVTSNGTISVLQPGQAIFSRKRVAEILNMSEKNARTALDFLKKLEIVATKPANRFTIISFVNWDRYQTQEQLNGPANGPTPGQQSANSRPTPGQQVATVLECKNVRMEECKNKDSGGQAPAPTPKSTRFVPPTPEQVQAYALSMGKRIDAQRFVDFYASKNWMVGKNKMSNWKAAVSGWIHREEERRQQRGPAAYGNTAYQPSNLADQVGF